MDVPPRERSVDMTNKQLAAMTRFGRRVTFLCPELGDITGYVIGFDDDNVRIAVVDGDKIVVRLRNRSYIGGMDANDENSLAKEPLKQQLEYMIAPFRKLVMNRYFRNHDQA